MPMTQQDILTHYQQEWKTRSDLARDPAALGYSNPVEDAILYPVYERLIADFNMKADGGRVLDVGSGSGRWIRFFLDRYRPRTLLGIDYAAASVALLDKWHGAGGAGVEFRLADITRPGLDLGATFDLINVANVLFHVPESELFAEALRNLARLVDPDGFVVVTEYLPRRSVRTEWMMVRNRYEFEAAVAAAGLQVSDVRAFSFFSNDPMGLDGPDAGTRHRFAKVRAGMQNLLSGELDAPTRKFLVELFAEIERAAIGFASERIAAIDMPSQKLVVLKRAFTGSRKQSHRSGPAA